jgi:hypothetical protein
MSLEEQLLDAVYMGDSARVQELIAGGADINARCDQGASVLFLACLQGNVEMVRQLLDHGADPNLVAAEPGDAVYAEKPLVLVMEAQALMDWAKYTPVYDLLIERGATGMNGTVPTAEVTALRLRNHMANQATARAARERRWWQFCK